MPLPAGYTLDQPQQPQGTPTGLPAGYKLDSPAQGQERPATSGSMALDFMQGGGAELIGTALGAYKLLRKIPGADKVLPAVSADVEQYAEPPKTVAAKLGRIFTELGEFAVPAGEAGALTKGAGLATRALAQGAAAGGTQLVRSGGNLPSAADAAAMGAAGPVVGAALGAAAPVAGRVLRAAPSIAADAIGMVHPKMGNAVRVAIKAYQAASKAAPEAAAAGAAAKTAGQAMAEASGQDWAKLSADEQQFMEQIAKAQGNAPPAAPAGPTTYQPRPPEYYGVKPNQTPPAAAPPQPAPSAPAPAQPASAAPPQASAAPPAAPIPPSGTRTVVRFPQGGKPGSVTRVPPPAAAAPASAAPRAATVEPIITPEPAPAPAQEPAAPPTPKPASKAPTANAQAKADRFVKAIQDYNAKFNAQPITADAIADLDDTGKSVLARSLSGNGLLPNIDANKFPNTSWPYIVTKLRQAEYSSR